MKEYFKKAHLPANYSPLTPFVEPVTTATHKKRTYTLMGTSTKTYGAGGRLGLTLLTLVKSIFFMFFLGTLKEEWSCVKSGKRQIEVYVIQPKTSQPKPDAPQKDPVNADSSPTLTLNPETPQTGKGKEDSPAKPIATPPQATADKVHTKVTTPNVAGTPFMNAKVVVPDKDCDAFEAGRRNAAVGNVQAQFDVGVMYLKGIGTKKNFEKAYEFFSKAEQSNHSGAKEQAAEAAYQAGVEASAGFNQKNHLKWFKQAADNGHTQAAYQLAGIFQQNKDDNNSIKYLRMAADQGHPDAVYFFGKKCQTIGNVRGAFTYYQLAAEKNHPEAAYELGEMYLNGNGVSSNIEEAKKYFRVAADKNCNAAYQLALLYWENGNGNEKAMKEAFEYFNKAAKSTSEVVYGPANYMIGFMYYEGKGIAKDVLQAFVNWDIAARKGHSEAKKNVNNEYQLKLRAANVDAHVAYQVGLNYVNKDEKKAMEFYNIASKKGNIEATYNLGIMHSCRAEDLEAFSLFTNAAEKGYLPAMVKLAECYRTGQGIKHNVNEAVKWLEKAANLGSFPAGNELGKMYLSGTGVTVSCQKAIEILTMCEDKNPMLGATAYQIGTIYDGGGSAYNDPGFQKNESKAIKWFKKAAIVGNKAAQILLTKRKIPWK